MGEKMVIYNSFLNGKDMTTKLQPGKGSKDSFIDTTVS
jgi:hypothetical protein